MTSGFGEGGQSSRLNHLSKSSVLGNGSVIGDDDDELNMESNNSKVTGTSKMGDGLHPQPSRQGGWSNDRKEGSINFEDDRLRPRSPQEKDVESDSDIPFIPELEDQERESMAGQVAMAPHMAVNRVATYKELDTELLQHSAFTTLDNEIDLKLLAVRLSAAKDVIEEDGEWNWDRLFAEVTSELATEMESQEEKTAA